MEPQQDRLNTLGLGARALTYFLLFYWALFAVLAPVTIWDSQVYNLGRLPIAEIGGLFGNTLWTSERQLVFPWTFDSLHLPFLHLGWGFGIPSFLCLLGTLVVAWSLLRRWHNATTAWIGCLALLALPTLVFQGVSTKNDIPILFGIAVWLHALLRWRDSRQRRFLLLGAIALGFAAGAKTSGIAPAGICALITLATLHRSFSQVILFSGAMFLSLLLLGSGETYFAAYRVFGGPLGSAGFVQANRNRDGARGAAANGIRYALGNVNLGVEAWQDPDKVTPVLEDTCRRLLVATHLAEAGHRGSDADDARMRFLKNGFDSASDFGPLGTLCILTLGGALVFWRPRELWWRLSIFAGVTVATVCFSVAWMPWNNRFLLLPFVSLAIALVSLVRRYSGFRQWPLWILGAASAYSGVVYPLLSFNKRPIDLIDSVFHRRTEEFKERPTMEPVMATVQAWRAAHPNQTLWLLAGSDSWVLPFFLNRGPKAKIIHSTELASEFGKIQPPETGPALLVLNRPDFRPIGLPLRLAEGFPSENGSGLYESRESIKGASLPKASPGINVFADGWTGCYFVVNISNWREDSIAMDLWNPTPLKRSVALKSTVETIRLDLEPQVHAAVHIKVEAFDSVEGTLSPAFRPGGAETRELGVILTISGP